MDCHVRVVVIFLLVLLFQGSLRAADRLPLILNRLIEREGRVKKLLEAQMPTVEQAAQASPLHHAVLVDNETAVGTILSEKYAKAVPKDSVGRTPLHYAAINGSVISVLWLLGRVQRGDFSVDIEDDMGFTPLYYATYYQRATIIKLLLQKGADQNKESKYGHTPAFLACRSGNKEIMSLFTQDKASKKLRKKYAFGYTPLHKAVFIGDLEEAEKILQEDPSQINVVFDGKTPLDIALNSFKVVRAEPRVENRRRVDAAIIALLKKSGAQQAYATEALERKRCLDALTDWLNWIRTKIIDPIFDFIRSMPSACSTYQS